MHDVDLRDENEKNTQVDEGRLPEVRRQQKGVRKQPPYRITRNRRAVIVGRPNIKTKLTVSGARRALRR